MIIGICGRKGHGKSELASQLFDQFSLHKTIVCLSMASPIKDMAQALGLTSEQCYGNLKEVPDPRFGNKTPREIMQTLGTEWGRKMICDDIWSSAWKAKVESSKYDIIICDDIRFPNEVKALAEVGGKLIGVIRPGLETSIGSDHESESLDIQKATPLIVYNTGTIEEMYQQAVCYLE